MTTITRERLLKIQQWRETYGPGSNVVLPAEEAEELARIALASLEAEPVAWTDAEELRDANNGSSGYLFSIGGNANKFADPRRQLFLYTAPPAPVVPEERPTEGEGILFWQRQQNEGWNLCRAAMLQGKAEPVSNRDELPFDQWLSQQNGKIDVDCGCVTTEAFFHWLRVAYESGNSPATPECSCRTCRPVTMTDMRFVVCPECGNKRCPHANDHRNDCTGSNEPGQAGSAYPAAPQQEAE